jgi:hypothetical protein
MQHGTQVRLCGKAPCRAAAAGQQLKEHGDLCEIAERLPKTAGRGRSWMAAIQPIAEWLED